jgi:hypothetical protein
MSSRSQKDIKRQRLERTPAQDLEEPQSGEAPNTDEDTGGYRDADMPPRGEGPDIGHDADDGDDEGDAE